MTEKKTKFEIEGCVVCTSCNSNIITWNGIIKLSDNYNLICFGCGREYDADQVYSVREDGYKVWFFEKFGSKK